MKDGPEPLVEALLAALRDGLDAGATALWAALTPRARAPLVDLDGVRRALANELLSPLVGHAWAQVGAWERADGVARTRVSVRGADDEAATYLLSSRREADGAWRISGLRRDDLPWS